MLSLSFKKNIFPKNKLFLNVCPMSDLPLFVCESFPLSLNEEGWSKEKKLLLDIHNAEKRGRGGGISLFFHREGEEEGGDFLAKFFSSSSPFLSPHPGKHLTSSSFFIPFPSAIFYLPPLLLSPPPPPSRSKLSRGQMAISPYSHKLFSSSPTTFPPPDKRRRQSSISRRKSWPVAQFNSTTKSGKQSFFFNISAILNFHLQTTASSHKLFQVTHEMIADLSLSLSHKNN